MSGSPTQESGEERATLICHECGARMVRDRARCWLCGAVPTVPSPTVDDVSPSIAHLSPEDRFSFSLTSLLLLITLASVGFGLIVIVPGFGIFASILMLPALLRTITFVRRQETAGRPVSQMQRVGLFAGFFAVAVVLTIVVCVAAFCSFCGVCLLIFGTPHDAGLLVPGIGMCLLAVFAITALVYYAKYRRKQRRRETEETQL